MKTPVRPKYLTAFQEEMWDALDELRRTPVEDKIPLYAESGLITQEEADEWLAEVAAKKAAAAEAAEPAPQTPAKPKRARRAGVDGRGPAGHKPPKPS